jgi:CBS domain containing-hemolysin-like protein
LNVNGYPIEIVETDDNRVRSVRVGQRDDIPKNSE